jgi:hypothetical protein
VNAPAEHVGFPNRLDGHAETPTRFLFCSDRLPESSVTAKLRQPADSPSGPLPFEWAASMLWRVSSRPVRSRSKPPGFILPCQPALAERPPSDRAGCTRSSSKATGSLPARTASRSACGAETASDYSKAFTRIRDAVAALRSIAPCSMARRLFCAPHRNGDAQIATGAGRGGLGRLRHMEADGQDVRPEPLEERRKRLAKLLSHKTKVMPDGTQVSEAITGLERVVPDDGRGRSRPRCHRSTDPRRASGSTTHRRR